MKSHLFVFGMLIASLVVMGILKAISVIMAWILLSFFWVSMGQSAERHCANYGQIDVWLKPYPTLASWYHFYADRQQCEPRWQEFFKTLASSEPFSIKLNEQRVSFEQFYVPVYNILAVSDWKRIGDEDSQRIQSDLSSIDHSLSTAMGKMSDADRDYFRSMVLLDLSSDFVEIPAPVAATTPLI